MKDKQNRDYFKMTKLQLICYILTMGILLIIAIML
jgi:hypothetical protein